MLHVYCSPLTCIELNLESIENIHSHTPSTVYICCIIFYNNDMPIYSYLPTTATVPTALPINLWADDSSSTLLYSLASHELCANYSWSTRPSVTYFSSNVILKFEFHLSFYTKSHESVLFCNNNILIQALSYLMLVCTPSSTTTYYLTHPHSDHWSNLNPNTSSHLGRTFTCFRMRLSIRITLVLLTTTLTWF